MAISTYRGSRAELAHVLRQAVRVASGRGPDSTGAAKAMMTRVGIAALAEVRIDFITKARGGVGRDGIRWRPLLRSTIAARRVTIGEWRGGGLKGTPTRNKYQRGLLTDAQNKRWKQIYASRLARLNAQGVAGAKAIAARIAWAVLKSEGAKTKLAVFGGRSVEIGRDTGRMFASLSPGVEDRPSGEADQIFRVRRGSVIVGSNVVYFPKFHRVRPVWPLDGSIPAAWWSAIRSAARTGFVRLFTDMLRGAQP